MFNTNYLFMIDLIIISGGTILIFALTYFLTPKTKTA
jgi:hypothetical protein